MKIQIIKCDCCKKDITVPECYVFTLTIKSYTANDVPLGKDYSEVCLSCINDMIAAVEKIERIKQTTNSSIENDVNK